MRRLWLLAIVAIGLVACGEILPFGVDSSNACSYVVKAHKRMKNELSLDCLYGDSCSANVHFGVLVFGNNDSELTDPKYCLSTTHYTYTYEKNEKKQNVNLGTNIPISLDPDDHIRFSLFDSANVEKVYDIDLSAIIHSYTVKDDSVIVNVALFDEVHFYTIHENYELENFELDDGYYSQKVDDSFKPYFYYNKNLRNQSSFMMDDFYTYGLIYWK